MAESIKPGGNGYDPQEIDSYVRRIEALDADLDSLRGKYMADCRSIKEDQASVIEEANVRSKVPKKALKKVLKERALARKIEALRAELEGDEQDSFDLLRQALGMLSDLPLGEAALNGAQKRRGGRKATEPDAAAVKARTEAELADAPAEVSETFAERMRRQNEAVDAEIRDGAAG